MVDGDGKQARDRRWHAAWVVGWVMTSACGYPALERLADAAAPDPPYVSVDGPSCAGQGAGARTCGGGMNESCCRAELVPGGMFIRGYDGVGYNNPGYPATVSTFALDKV